MDNIFSEEVKKYKNGKFKGACIFASCTGGHLSPGVLVDYSILETILNICFQKHKDEIDKLKKEISDLKEQLKSK